jgi:hypothetical protein
MNNEFKEHVASHLASMLALKRARELDTTLYGMVMSALEGTWNAAQSKACKSCKEFSDVD